MFQLSKKKIVIGIVIWILCLLITFLLVTFFNKNDKNSDKLITEKTEIVENKFKGIDYYGLYDENDLKINSDPYIQIDGLKNEEIQNKINQELFEKTKDMYSKTPHIYVIVYANFSNILSLYAYSYETEHSYFNYDLTTGNKIKFEDLFTDNANITSLVSAGFYDALSTNYSFELQRINWAISAYENNPNTCSQYYCGEPIEDLLAKKKQYEEDLANLEDIVLSKVNKFMKDNNKQFYISNEKIVVFDGETPISIMIEKKPEYYAYYERYQTDESIFKDENIGKENLFIASSYNSSIAYNYVEYISDYGLIDSASGDVLPEVIQNKLSNLYSEYKSNMNSTKFTYLNMDSHYGLVFMEEDIYSYNITINKCEMSKDYFKSEFNRMIIDLKANTNRMGFNNITYLSEDIDASCKSTNIGYVIDSNNKVYENEEIFIDSFDYKTYLNDRYYEQESRFMENAYTEEEKANHNFLYKFNGSYINVILDDVDISISLDMIPREYLKF